MEKEIVIFEENEYIKSNALFDKVFSKLDKEIDMFDEIYSDYKKNMALKLCKLLMVLKLTVEILRI